MHVPNITCTAFKSLSLRLSVSRVVFVVQTDLMTIVMRKTEKSVRIEGVTNGRRKSWHESQSDTFNPNLARRAHNSLLIVLWLQLCILKCMRLLLLPQCDPNPFKASSSSTILCHFSQKLCGMWFLISKPREMRREIRREMLEKEKVRHPWQHKEVYHPILLGWWWCHEVKTWSQEITRL